MDSSIVLKVAEDAKQIARPFEETQSTGALKPSLLRATSSHHVTHAFCLGLGPMTSGPSANQKRSIAQLGAFLWLVDGARSSKGPDDLQRLAVDPGFTPPDGAVLEQLRVKMALDSKDFDKQTLNHSLLYAPYLPWPVLILDYLNGGSIKPSLLVCQDLQSIKENLEMWTKTPNGQRVIEVDGRACSRDDLTKAVEGCKVILRDYDACRFPIYEPLPDAFRDLVVYTKKVDDSEAEEERFISQLENLAICPSD